MLIEILLLCGSLAKMPADAALRLTVEDASYVDQKAEQLLVREYPMSTLLATNSRHGLNTFTVELSLEQLDTTGLDDHVLVIRGHLSLHNEAIFQTGDYLSRQSYRIDPMLPTTNKLFIELSEIK